MDCQKSGVLGWSLNVEAKKLQILTSSNGKLMNKKIKIKKTGSLIRQPQKQIRIVKGLGLRKTNSVREIEDTPSVRGMLDKVAHLVKVID